MLSIPKSFKKKREALGATVEEFAELLGMKGATTSYEKIRSWEAGQSEPSSRELEFISKLPNRFNRQKKFNHKFIDLFAGIGGIRSPFEARGGKCVFTSEWDKFARRTYALNYGEIPSGDITKIKAADIPEHDLLLAGFPCQAFSQAGLRKGFADTRGTLFFDIQRILAYRQPKAFLLENVKQLKGHDKGRTFRTIVDILTGNQSQKMPSGIELSDESRIGLETTLNYDVGYKILSANNFGVPQKRERIYIVGFHKGTLKRHKLGEAQKILDALSEQRKETRLGDILEPNASVDKRYTLSDRLWQGHQRRLLEHRARGNGFGYSLFDSDSPYCNTISARYYKDGSEILIDQSDINRNPRKLTPRECARIQGFSENFRLDAVSDNQLYKQFGNSVSVPVVDAIAQKIIKVIKSG